MVNLSIFRFSRNFVFLTLCLVSCLAVLLFLVAKPVEAEIPGWSWALKYLNSDNGGYDTNICVQNIRAVLAVRGIEADPYEGTAVYSVVGDNIVVNVCVDRPGYAPAIVTFVTGGNGTAETQPLRERISEALDYIGR